MDAFSLMRSRPHNLLSGRLDVGPLYAISLNELNRAFKKRLNNNFHRSIILAKGGKFWIYEYLFAKKDRENIENDELLVNGDFAAIHASAAALQKVGAIDQTTTGSKQPSGMALKLLAVVQKHGLGVLA